MGEVGLPVRVPSEKLTTWTDEKDQWWDEGSGTLRWWQCEFCGRIDQIDDPGRGWYLSCASWVKGCPSNGWDKLRLVERWK